MSYLQTSIGVVPAYCNWNKNPHQSFMNTLDTPALGITTEKNFFHKVLLFPSQILKLSYNKLTRVNPSMFEGLTNLVRLHLDHNLIDFIEPFSFTGLLSLKLLQLESNRLQDLHPHTFTTVSLLGTFWGSSLRHLYLADNQLQYLVPGTFQHLSRLEVLSLHNNPWICDCQLHWLLEWNQKHDGEIFNTYLNYHNVFNSARTLVANSFI